MRYIPLPSISKDIYVMKRSTTEDTEYDVKEYEYTSCSGSLCISFKKQDKRTQYEQEETNEYEDKMIINEYTIHSFLYSPAGL
jgi:hypothetical protein